MSRCASISVAFRVQGGPWQLVRGRLAQAVTMLASAGERGVSCLETGNSRLAATIHRLRRENGLHIETKHVAHNGPFPSLHAEYVCIDRIEFGNVETICRRVA